MPTAPTLTPLAATPEGGSATVPDALVPGGHVPTTRVRDEQVPASLEAAAPGGSIRPLRHLPRRESTATSVLRALPGEDTPGTASAAGRAVATPADTSPSSTRQGVRALTLRDLAAGGGGATLSWTLAAHLGLLGTAGGTFLISVASAVAVALAGDSLRGLRGMALRTVRTARERRMHRPRVRRER